jgi:hypothetical protein
LIKSEKGDGKMGPSKKSIERLFYNFKYYPAESKHERKLRSRFDELLARIAELEAALANGCQIDGAECPFLTVTEDLRVQVGELEGQLAADYQAAEIFRLKHEISTFKTLDAINHPDVEIGRRSVRAMDAIWVLYAGIVDDPTRLRRTREIVTSWKAETLKLVMSSTPVGEGESIDGQ